MTNNVGEAIFVHRKKIGQTQDQFGARFHVSGPAVFKFEKGYVRPSLNVWLKISEDMNIPRTHAVLMWLKDRLPDEFSDLIDLKDEEPVKATASKAKKGVVDYTELATPEDVRKQAMKDKNLPRGLAALMKDKKTWDSCKPTGEEVNFLRDSYQAYPHGTRQLYADALVLYRRFMRGRR